MTKKFCHPDEAIDYVEEEEEERSYEDLMGVMVEKMDGDAFMEELLKGFMLLADPASGLITLASLKRNAVVLGLDSLSDSDLEGMLREGDLNGDGALDEREFCVLMIRLSPELMSHAKDLLLDALAGEMPRHHPPSSTGL